MTEPIFLIEEGDGPLVAAAIHDGHDVRDDVRRHLALPEGDRLREEDPFTREWTSVGDTRIIGLRSRFEVDLNRDADTAVYLKPSDAWGLDVWKDGPPPHLIDESLHEYETFYDAVAGVLDETVRRHGRILVYDIHSYNHRRGGPGHAPEEPELNPEINVGTGTMDRKRWAPVVEGFMASLREVDFMGRRLDVRENIKFTGGHFPEWIHHRYPDAACALAIEIKKFFMDEWTGEPYWDVIEALRGALERTVQPALAGFDRVHSTI